MTKMMKRRRRRTEEEPLIFKPDENGDLIAVDARGQRYQAHVCTCGECASSPQAWVTENGEAIIIEPLPPKLDA